MDHLHEVLLVTGSDVDTIQNTLTTAVRTATALAMANSVLRHGILVTQHDYVTFSVAISPKVPYGLTLEQRQFGTTPNVTTVADCCAG